MDNRDIYKDEFGQYHEVEEELEDLVDGLEDDDYAKEHRVEFDADDE